MTRVLSTETARSAVERLRTLVDDQLTNELRSVQIEGATLSDPEVWDGVEAARFRSDTWPRVDHALRAAVAELQALQQQVQVITANIMAAGGNG